MPLIAEIRALFGSRVKNIPFGSIFIPTVLRSEGENIWTLVGLNPCPRAAALTSTPRLSGSALKLDLMPARLIGTVN